MAESWEEWRDMVNVKLKQAEEMGGNDRVGQFISRQDELESRVASLELTRELMRMDHELEDAHFPPWAKALQDQLQESINKPELGCDRSNHNLLQTMLEGLEKRVLVSETMAESREEWRDMVNVKLKQAEEMDGNDRVGQIHTARQEGWNTQMECLVQELQRRLDAQCPEREIMQQQPDLQAQQVGKPIGAGRQEEGDEHEQENRIDVEEQENEKKGFEFNQECYTIPESVWDSLLIVGTPIIGKSSSLLLILLNLLNVFVQLLFCAVIAENFGLRQYSHKDTTRLAFFRALVGHDVKFTSSLWPSSLASRLCDRDVTLQTAASQERIFENVQQYTGSHFDGNWLCAGALFCWWLNILNELSDMFTFIKVTLHLVGESDLHELKHAGSLVDVCGDSFRMIAVSRARFGQLAALTIVRFSVAMLLLLVGSQWLMHTISLEALLLNAVALGFILDIDELIFTGLAPLKAKLVVRGMEPVVTAVHLFRITGATAWASLFSLCIGTVVTFVLVLAPASHINDDIIDALCGGKTNFVYGLDSLGNVYLNDDMQSSDDVMSEFSTADPRWLAVQQSRDDIPKQDWKYAHYKELDSMQQLLKISVPDLIDKINPDCKDLLVDTTPPQDLHPWQASFRWQSGNPSVEFCNHVAPYCTSSAPNSNGETLSLTAKWLCPRTCGCNLVTSGSMHLRGCPFSCMHGHDQSYRNTVIASATCWDLDLVETESWQSWLEEAAEFNLDQIVLRPLRLHGCAALAMDGNESLDRLSTAQSLEACSGMGEWSSFKPLSPLCPSACGCDDLEVRQSNPDIPYHCPGSCESCYALNIISQNQIQHQLETAAFCSAAYREYIAAEEAVWAVAAESGDITYLETTANRVCAALQGMTSCLEGHGSSCRPRLSMTAITPLDPNCRTISETTFDDVYDQCYVPGMSLWAYWEMRTLLSEFEVNSTCVSQVCNQWENAGGQFADLQCVDWQWTLH